MSEVIVTDEYAFQAWISLKLDEIVRHDPKKIAAYIVTALKKHRKGKDAKLLQMYCRSKLEEFIEDKEKLNEFCEELCRALEDNRYFEVREHPSYATLLDQDSVPLTPSNKEYPTLKEEKHVESSQTRKRRSGSYSDDEDDSMEDHPARGRTSPLDHKVAVSSNISVVNENSMAKRLGKRQVNAARPSCKDFTDRGFCLRGQLCPYDHGTEPFVWQNARPLDVIRSTGPPRPPFPVMPQPQRLPGFPPMMPMGIMRQMPPRFRPDGPLGMPPFNMRPKLPPANFRPRELVGLAADDMMIRTGESMLIGKREGDTRIVNSIPAKRIAVESSSNNNSGNNCSLEINQVPFHLNNIGTLNSHFYKYGGLVNVQVRYNDDPGSALITFQTPDAASRAFNSAEPILNNRFITIAWHNALPKPAQPDTPKWTGKTVPATTTVSREKESGPVESSTVGSEDASGVTVTPGFTRGLRVRYPVGGRRLRATRFPIGATSRVAAVAGSQNNSSSQQPSGLSAHHRSIYLSLQATKTESEVETLQNQVATLDEKLSKVTTLIQSMQTIRMGLVENNASDSKKEEVAQMLEKIDSQILNCQNDHQHLSLERASTVKRQSELETRLNAQKHQIEAEKFGHENEGGNEHDEMETDSSSLFADRTSIRSRSSTQRLTRGRSGHLRGTRSPKRSTGVARFRRPTRGKPFNRTVDRRPRRLKLSGFSESDKQPVLDQIQSSGGIIESILSDLDNTPSILVNFNTRYDAETFLRDVTTALAGRKMSSIWLPDVRQGPVSDESHLDFQNLNLETETSHDAFDSDADDGKILLQGAPPPLALGLDDDENSFPIPPEKQMVTSTVDIQREEQDAR